MSEQRTGNLRDMAANYASLARRAMRFWKRAALVALVIATAGMAWVVKRQRIYRSEASAAIHDVNADATQGRGGEEALAELKARLDQVYGSRANLGRVVDELNLYPWLRGKTSRLKVIESFQDAVTYASSGRDALHLEFVYQDPAIAQRTVERLLQLYTDERRSAGQTQFRNDLASVNTALAGLENALGEQEERLEHFEHANHEMVEQVRLRRLGQMQARLGFAAGIPIAPAVASEPGDSVATRRLRIRLSALSARHAALQRAADSGATRTAPRAAAVEDSERTAGLRRATQELRERLARLRTTYTDEYPDVRIVARRVTESERELSAAVAADRARAGGVATPTGEPISAASLHSQLDSLAREMGSTRAALAESLHADRARGPLAPAAGPTAARGRSAPSAPPAQPAAATVAQGGGTGSDLDHPLGSLVEVESMWDRFTSDLTTTRTRYQSLLTRKFELSALLDTVNTTGADVLRVIDPPTLPVEPEPPGKTRLAAMVLALALLLGAATAGLSGFLDSKLYEPADLRRWGELPELPVIPDLRESSLVPSPPAPAAARARV